MAAVTAIAACDGSTLPKATSEVRSDTITVASLNGSPPAAAAGVSIFSGQAVPVDATFSFDLAFDIGPGGVVTVYPVQRVGNQLTSPRNIGIQKVSGVTFNALTSAPASGYRFDTTYTVTPGQPIAVAIADLNLCPSFLTGYTYYAKVGVDVVDTVARTIKLVSTIDPNCGYRSLAPGIPTE